MNADQFSNFINREQRYSGLNELLYPYVRSSEASAMIDKLEMDDTYKKKSENHQTNKFALKKTNWLINFYFNSDQLSVMGLMHYLMEYENGIVDPKKYELFDDMDQPLNEYYINSSHNTYLTGKQLSGRSDEEMYRQVLLSGCRCIEIDCHDNEGEPIVTHGKTLVTSISFVDTIKAINESAFKRSPYPVILSFENHCGFGISRYSIEIRSKKVSKILFV